MSPSHTHEGPLNGQLGPIRFLGPKTSPHDVPHFPWGNFPPRCTAKRTFHTFEVVRFRGYLEPKYLVKSIFLTSFFFANEKSMIILQRQSPTWLKKGTWSFCWLWNFDSQVSFVCSLNPPRYCVLEHSCQSLFQVSPLNYLDISRARPTTKDGDRTSEVAEDVLLGVCFYP